MINLRIYEDLKKISNIPDDPYERDFQPHRQPGPPYYTEDYSIYEYSYDEEPFFAYADHDEIGSPFYSENMEDSFSQYSDDFDRKEDEWDENPSKPVGQANAVPDVHEERSTLDDLQKPKAKAPLQTDQSSNDSHHLLLGDDRETDPGVDHYPHNAFR